jgi:hypothetical protein
MEDRRSKVHAGAKTKRHKDECHKCANREHYAIVCPTRDQKFTLICEEELPRHELDASNNSFTSYGEVTKEVNEANEVQEGPKLPVFVIQHFLKGKWNEENTDQLTLERPFKKNASTPIIGLHPVKNPVFIAANPTYSLWNVGGTSRHD